MATKSTKITIANIFIIYSDCYKERGRNGADMLRDCVNFLNDRNEVRNDNKTPLELLNEFADFLKD